MRSPKFQIGDVLKWKSGRGGTITFEVGQIIDCVKTFNYKETDLDLWAYGPVGKNPVHCTFERFLTKVTKLEKALK